MSSSTDSKKSSDQVTDEMITLSVLGILFLASVPVLIPALGMGYLILAAYRDRKEARVIRAALVFALFAGAIWFLIGPPTTSEALMKVLETRPKGSFNAAQYRESGLWDGLLIEQFPDIFKGFIRGTLGLQSVSLSGMYELLRALGYLALVGSLGAAVWLKHKSTWKSQALYRWMRRVFHLTQAPLLVLPLSYAMKGKRLHALILLCLETLAFTALSYWLLPKPLIEHGWFVGLMTYLGAGFLYSTYQLLYGAIMEWLRRGQQRGDSNSVILGRRAGDGSEASVFLTIPMLQHHVHVVGASGYGKSTLLSHLISHHVRHELGLIFVDLKADWETTREIMMMCDGAGRIPSLKILDLSRPELSLSYNPCRRGNATEIKDKIIGAFAWESEYYKNVAQSFLLTCLRGLVFLRDQKRLGFTLADIHACTTGPDALVALEMALNEALAPLELRESINELAQRLRSRESQKELQGLKTQLEMLLHSEFGEALKSDRRGIDFYDAIRDQEIVYVLLDSQTYGETARKLGRLILQDLKSCSGEISTRVPSTERVHCTIIVDEFADLATEQFVGLLNRARSSKLGIVIAHQELADLEASGISGLRDQVMANTATTVAFLQKNPESAERIASLAGTKTVLKRTRQLAEQAFLLWTEKQYTGVESEREVEEFVIHPNLIKRMTRGECVIVGKYPNAWHEHVFVNPKAPIRGETGIGCEETLREMKRVAEGELTGLTPLELQTRARELSDSGRKTSTKAAGLKREFGELADPMPYGTHQEDVDDRF